MATERAFLVPLNLNKNELRLMVLQVLASAPSSPVEGQHYYDSTLKRVRYWDGTQWIDETNRTNHTGTQTASTISDFDTQVRTSRLDQMAAPTASVSLNSQKITNLLDPTSAQDAATKSYVDATAVGLDVKPSVRAATTAALPTNTRTGNVLTASANGAIPAQDGVTLVLNDRLLVKDEAAGENNGLYFVSQVGSGGTPWTLTRTTDSDTSAEVTAGLFTFVEEGTTYGDTGWVLSTNNPITLNTTSLTFVQFSGAGAIVAGAGLTKTGNTLDVGQGTGIVVSADSIAIDTAVVVSKFAASIGDGSSLAYVVTHSLGTKDVTVAVYDNTTPFAEVEVDVEHTSTSTVTIRFSVAPTSNQYRVVVHG